MNAFAHLVLLAFAPAMSLLFLRLPLQVAILVTAVGGFLFLPVMSVPIPGFIDYNKANAIATALVLGVALGDRVFPRLPRLVLMDAICLLWLISPGLSYFANGYPAYSSISALIYRFLGWGVFYWIGRTYFQSAQDAKLLLRAVVVGALVYVPLCLWEVRMSPQLHTKLYGQFQHDFGQMIREGGFRPIVFTTHGLQVALWMSCAVIAAICLWRQCRVKAIASVPMAAIVGVLFTTLLLCKSLGALLLVVVVSPLAWWRTGGRALYAALPTFAVLYVLLRVFGGDAPYEWASALVNLAPPERAESAQFRLDQEVVLLRHGWEQPAMGWTNEQKNPNVVLYDYEDAPHIVVDSLWIICFVTSGLFGLLTFLLLASSAGLRAIGRHIYSARLRGQAGHYCVSMLVTMWLIDSLANADDCPIYIIAIGAVVGANLGSRETLPGETAPAPQASAAPALAARPRPRRKRLVPRR